MKKRRKRRRRSPWRRPVSSRISGSCWKWTSLRKVGGWLTTFGRACRDWQLAREGAGHCFLLENTCKHLEISSSALFQTQALKRALRYITPKYVGLYAFKSPLAFSALLCLVYLKIYEEYDTVLGDPRVSSIMDFIQNSYRNRLKQWANSVNLIVLCYYVSYSFIQYEAAMPMDQFTFCKLKKLLHEFDPPCHQ